MLKITREALGACFMNFLMNILVHNKTTKIGFFKKNVLFKIHETKEKITKEE